MPEILKAEILNKYFYEPSDFHVLKDVSLTVNKGEFATIIGKSGSGKSTLMHLLATLDTDYTGTITINNEKVSGLKQNTLAKFRNQHIGFIFQSHYLLPEFTALQNVMIPALKLKKKNVKEIEIDARAILGQMEMEEFTGHLAVKLSGGQQQRVAIGRALINNPDIIMADEPTGNLDSTNSAIILDIFRNLSTKGNTILAITHDKDFAARADKQIEIADGMIKAN